jgi:hypothetical protein
MLIRKQVKDDFVSTVARLEVAAATLRAGLATLVFSCAAELDVRFVIKESETRPLLLTLQAASII